MSGGAASSRPAAGPEAVLFDAGGTLILLDAEGVGDALEPVIGQRPDPDRLAEAHYRAMAGLSARPGLAAGPVVEWWPWWIRRFLGAAGVEPTEEAVRAFRQAEIPWSQPVPEAAGVVRAVREAGIRVAVVSNSDGKVDASLAEAGLLGLFEFVVDSHHAGVAKPDPGIFRIALRRLGLPPERVWYVGDSLYYDVKGAEAAGLAAAVLVDPLGLAPGGQLRVSSLEELPGLLDISTS